MTIQEQIENLQKQIKDAQYKIDELKLQATKIWKPADDERYYLVSSFGHNRNCIWCNDESDQTAFSIGNVFKTNEEVVFMIEKLKVIAELKRFAEMNNEPIDWANGEDKYFLYVDVITGTVDYDSNITWKHSDVYFSSYKIAEQAVKAIGEDRLKKYYFEVE